MQNRKRSYPQKVEPHGKDSGFVGSTRELKTLLDSEVSKRKLAERRLKEQRLMSQLIMENIPMRIFWKNRNLKYLGCNTIFAKDAGKKSPKELIGHNDFEMGWAKQARLYRADDRRVISAGKPKLAYEEPQTTPDGDLIWLETSKVPLRNADNEIIGILGMYSDVTKRKEIEQTLQKSEKKFSVAFETSPYVLIISYLKDGKILEVNSSFTSMSGFSRKEVLGKSTTELSLWAFPENRKAMIAELKKNGRVAGREYQFRAKSGEILTGLYSARMIDINGSPCILSSIADITELKRAQAEILELKERDEAVLTSIGDAVFACDKDGNVLLFNKAAEVLTGFPAHRVIGQKYTKIITLLREADEKPVGDLVSKAIKENKVIKNTNHTLLIAKTGTKIPVVNSIAPIKKPTGDVVGCVVTFRDVTQERAVDRTKTEFVSLASHQLRTPLTAINWYCEMLLSEDNAKLTDKQRYYANETYKASKRMVKLMDALLNVSRLEMGTFTIEPNLLNVVDVAKISISELKTQISKNMLVLRETYDDNLPLLSADSKLLTIIIQNLLSNAVKYTPVRGQVELAIHKIEKGIVLTVADNGIGIPASQQGQVFTKMFRADNVKKIDPEGTGLGLYMVKTIVEATGGKIWFTSTEGKGSKFNVSFPLTGMKRKPGTKSLV